ncbi:MAG TPA: MBL fold metallo-hydrolase [Acetobacteraceae bacterium]|nr:MBL fold metallo-hydrolase [Acetobacteraceae bacterium]
MSQWRIGDVTVTKIVEQEVNGGSRRLLPPATPDWLRPHLAEQDACLRLSIHSFVVQTATTRIIVDTCLGNDKQKRPVPYWNRRQGPFLAALAAAGCPAETIDTVVNTHLHIDHVGWNTMLRQGQWVPTFPRAHYLISGAEYEYWHDHAIRDDTRQMLADSVTPVVEAGVVDLVEADHRICDEVRLVATPGHTPGHLSVHIASRGEEALITGDFMHHPCQVAHPDFELTSDSDPALGTRTRWEMFDRLADRPVLVLISHFAGATAGYVVRDGGGYRFAV